MKSDCLQHQLLFSLENIYPVLLFLLHPIFNLNYTDVWNFCCLWMRSLSTSGRHGAHWAVAPLNVHFISHVDFQCYYLMNVSYHIVAISAFKHNWEQPTFCSQLARALDSTCPFLFRYSLLEQELHLASFVREVCVLNSLLMCNQFTLFCIVKVYF